MHRRLPESIPKDPAETLADLRALADRCPEAIPHVAASEEADHDAELRAALSWLLEDELEVRA